MSEDTDLTEVAKLLVAHRIKRVPVVREGRIVGIVSRADIVRAMAMDAPPEPASVRTGGLFADALTSIENHFRHHQSRDHARGAVTEPAPTVADEGRLKAADFRALVADFEHQKIEHRREDQQAATERRRERIAQLISTHITEPSWRQLMHRAHEAAANGEKEFMLLRFPSGLCSDGGRAINNLQPGWPQTLRGEGAEIYLRWENDLKPQGFPIGARVLDFPGGMPGDIGLFLEWGM